MMLKANSTPIAGSTLYKSLRWLLTAQSCCCCRNAGFHHFNLTSEKVIQFNAKCVWIGYYHEYMNIHMETCVVKKCPRDLSFAISAIPTDKNSAVHLSHKIRVICLNSTPNPRTMFFFFLPHCFGL